MEKLYKKIGKSEAIKEIQKYLDDKESGDSSDEDEEEDDGSLF